MNNLNLKSEGEKNQWKLKYKSVKMKTGYQQVKTSKTKNWPFEKINTICKLLARLTESQTGVKIARRNINNLR